MRLILIIVAILNFLLMTVATAPHRKRQRERLRRSKQILDEFVPRIR